MSSSSDTPNERAARRAQQVKDRREKTARDRNAQRQKKYVQNKRELTIIKAVAAVVVVGIVAAIGLSVWRWGQDRELNRKPDGVRAYSYAGQQHDPALTDYTLDPDYQGEIPPAGGTHNPTWQKCGVYDGPVPWQNAVHDLEHGAIWLSYRPDLPAEDIAKLRALGDADEMLVAPEPLLTSPIVLTAWGNQLSLDTYDDATVKRFIRYYKNNPEAAPEAGANCSEGNTSLRPEAAVAPATPASPVAATDPIATATTTP